MRFRKRKKGSYFPYLHKKLTIKPLNIRVNYLWKQCH